MVQERNLENRLRLLVPKLYDTAVWLPVLKSMDSSQLARTLKRELFQVGDLALRAVAIGDTQRAVNWLALGFYCNQTIARGSVATSGVFRSSKYNYKAKHLLEVVVGLKCLTSELSLTEEVINYLNSIEALSCLTPGIARMDQTLRRFLKRNGKFALKSIVARMDALFMTEHEVDYRGNTDNLNTYTKEELGEGASYIIHCIDNDIGIKTTHFMMMSEKKVSKGIFDKMLIKACKIRRFCEAEILVDAFNYRCNVNRRTVNVASPTPELEKSIRLGYAQDELSRNHRRLERAQAITQGAISVFDLADRFYDNYPDIVVKRLDDPISRYTFHLPNVPPMQALFSTDELTVEEDLYLREIVNTELVTWDEVRTFEVSPGLTLLDFSRVHRLFLFTARLAMRKLAPLLLEDPVLAYRSLVPVFKAKDLKGLLAWCVKPELIDEVLELLSWQPGSVGVYDLQYTPIMHVENHYLVPLHITGMTNWYRNLVRLDKNRLIDFADQEAAPRALGAALRQGGCDYVREGYKTKFEGKTIEIDAVCRFGEYLFLFECKHPILPCNVHELRTSYKHVLKGARQLGLLIDLLEDEAVELELYRRLGWNLERAREIITCIVSCNGTFSGLRVEGHPVRRLTELCNMIETGVIKATTFSVDPDVQPASVRAENLLDRSLWEGPKLTPDFLHQYIKQDRLIATLFGGMVEYEQIYSLEDWKISFTTYALDTGAVADALAKIPVADGV